MKLAEQLRATPEIAAVAVADGGPSDRWRPGESTLTLRIESRRGPSVGGDDARLHQRWLPRPRLRAALPQHGPGDVLRRGLLPALSGIPSAGHPCQTAATPWGRVRVMPYDSQNDRDLTDEPITMHTGIIAGVGDLGQEFEQGEAVVKITIQRVE